TGRNAFSVFGAAPANTAERDGKLRCQGAFRHPILAGTYAATLFPLFVGLWFQKGRNKIAAIVGGCCAVVATIAASSSGSVLALGCSVVGLALWCFRFKMRLFRWSVVGT